MKCNICDKEFKDIRILAYHISRSHKNITLRDYTVKYFYDKIVPICGCGCKQETTYKCFGKFRNYISGHNPNGFKGKHHTKESITRMLNHSGRNLIPSRKQNIFKECLQCKNKFKVVKSNYDVKKFCSASCYSIFIKESIKNKTAYGMEYSKNHMLAGSLGITRGKISKPEQEFALKLKKYNINFQSQYKIMTSKLNIVDFYIPDEKLVIQIDGDYWHCNPKKFKETDYHSRIKKFAKDIWLKDYLQILDLKNAGYKVKRIWESDIKHINNLSVFIKE